MNFQQIKFNLSRHQFSIFLIKGQWLTNRNVFSINESPGDLIVTTEFLQNYVAPQYFTPTNFSNDSASSPWQFFPNYFRSQSEVLHFSYEAGHLKHQNELFENIARPKKKSPNILLYYRHFYTISQIFKTAIEQNTSALSESNTTTVKRKLRRKKKKNHIAI